MKSIIWTWIRRSRIFGNLLGLLCGLVPLIGDAAVKPTVAKPATPAPSAPPVTAPAPLPQSIFLYNITPNGRDPFFPESPRRHKQDTTIAGHGAAAPVKVLPALRGIIRDRLHPAMALIQDQTLRVGESCRLTLSGRDVLVRCLEIRSDMVVITVDNLRHELTLPLN